MTARMAEAGISFKSGHTQVKFGIIKDSNQKGDFIVKRFSNTLKKTFKLKLLEHNSAVFLPPSFFDLKVYFETRRGALPLFSYFNSSHKMALPII